jgi:hypothetical protein
VDLLESGDEREQRQLLRSALVARLPAWTVGVVAVLVLGTLGGGVAGAVQVSRALQREAARPEVDVLPDRASSSSTTVAGVARGRIGLRLVNRRDRPVSVGQLEVGVEGLRVLQVEPDASRPLGPREQRRLRISFVVPSCDALVLPGTLSLVLVAQGRPFERKQVPVVDPDAADPPPGALTLGACPASARGAAAGTPTDIGVRPAGGSSRRTGAGAEGLARLEIRNVGSPLRLLSVDAEVPGVLFTPRVLDGGGRTLETDGLVRVRLAFRVEDCRALQKSGRLVLRVERFDGVQELGLRVTAEPAARVGPQVDLRVVLDSCG